MSFDLGSAIQGGIQGFLLTGSPAGAAAGFVIGGTAGGDAKRSAKNKARDAYNQAQRDRAQMVQSATGPHKIVYGEALASGPLAYAQTTGDKGQYLHLVVLLAAHEVQSIGEVYLGDQPLGTLDGSGFVTAGSFGVVTTVQESYSSASTSFTLPYTPADVIEVIVFVAGGDADGGYSTTIAYSLVGANITITGTPPSGATNYSVVYTRQASFAPLVRCKKYLGTDAQTADADLIAESAGKWTSAHRLRGRAHLYLRLEYNQDVFGAMGIPNVSAVVKGRKVYDPRKDSTAGGSGAHRAATPSTWEWSDNSALCAADYLRNYMAASAAELPAADLTAAANVCDQLVTLTAGGATEKRYTANGVLSTESPPKDNLDALLESMAGQAPYVQGRFAIQAGAHTSSVLTITEDMLADGAISIQPARQRTELFNRVTPKYVEPTKLYATVEATPVTNATYVAADGGLDLPQDVTYDLCNGQLRAQRLAKIELERNRQGLTLQLTCKLAAYIATPGDVVTVTLARYGFSSKLFVVEDRTLDIMSGTVRLALRETAAGVWDWAYGDATAVDLSPNTSLPSPFGRPAAVTTLAFGTAGTDRLADGTLLPTLPLTWDAVPDVFVRQGGRIEVQWRHSDETTWRSEPSVSGDAVAAKLVGPRRGSVVIARVRAVRGTSGTAGEWAYKSKQVASSAAARYRVVARGGSDTAGPLASGLYHADSGALVQGSDRSYVMVRISRTTGAVTFARVYDVFGVGTLGSGAGNTAATLAADLNASTSASIVVVWTHDEPQTHRTDSGLPDAMYRCGASRAVFGSTGRFMFRGAYVLVGIPGIGEGNGREAYSGAVASSTTAYCDVVFSIDASGLLESTGPGAQTLSIGTDLLEANAATEVSQSSAALQTFAVTGGAGGTIDWNIATWVNTLGYDVNVELSSSMNMTVTTVSGVTVSVTDSYLVADVYTTVGGAFYASWGESNPEAPIPVVGASSVARFNYGRVVTVLVPAGKELRTKHHTTYTSTGSAGGNSIVGRDLITRFAIVKR